MLDSRERCKKMLMACCIKNSRMSLANFQELYEDYKEDYTYLATLINLVTFLYIHKRNVLHMLNKRG